jgi:threonine dehydratase
MSQFVIDYPDIQCARARIRHHGLEPTPIHRWYAFEERSGKRGLRVYVKCENLTPIGAFKIRGALNAVMSLTEAEARYGVATHSSGNHGTAVAYAARARGIPATVVVPENASPQKMDLIRHYGAELVTCEPTQKGREEALARLVQERGRVAIHPYDHPAVMAGQGTVADEFLDDIPDLDWLFVPIGGGGLISGTAVTVRTRRPRLRLIGVEPEGANDTQRSLEAGTRIPHPAPDTVADGLRAFVGTLTFPIIQKWVDQVLTVTDPEIRNAVRWGFEELRMVVEPSAATVLAALSRTPLPERARVGLILTGGNVDPGLWASLRKDASAPGT